MPVPGAVSEHVLGDGAPVALDGQRVDPGRLSAQGFVWRFPEIDRPVYVILACASARRVSARTMPRRISACGGEEREPCKRP